MQLVESAVPERGGLGQVCRPPARSRGGGQSPAKAPLRSARSTAPGILPPRARDASQGNPAATAQAEPAVRSAGGASSAEFLVPLLSPRQKAEHLVGTALWLG